MHAKMTSCIDFLIGQPIEMEVMCEITTRSAYILFIISNSAPLPIMYFELKIHTPLWSQIYIKSQGNL